MQVRHAAGGIRMGRRRESRLNIYLPGSYERASEEIRHVEVSELSSNGCRLTDQGSNLSAGDDIKLSFGAVQTMSATVRWANDGLIGVEFATPLDEAIVTFFAAYCTRAA